MVVSNILRTSVVVGGVVLILFFLMAITKNNQEQREFEQFIRMFNKSYVNSTERNIRFKRFQVRHITCVT
jgi:hypothetical protein